MPRTTGTVDQSGNEVVLTTGLRDNVASLLVREFTAGFIAQPYFEASSDVGASWQAQAGLLWMSNGTWGSGPWSGSGPFVLGSDQLRLTGNGAPQTLFYLIALPPGTTQVRVRLNEPDGDGSANVQLDSGTVDYDVSPALLYLPGWLGTL